MSKKVTIPEAATTEVRNTVAESTPVKAPAKKKKNLPEIVDYMEAEGLDTEASKIETILALHVKGYTNKEIIEAGFNKSTVYRQVGEYKKLKRGPIKTYMGFPVFEARVERVMKARKMTREEAVEHIMAKDLEG